MQHATHVLIGGLTAAVLLGLSSSAGQARISEPRTSGADEVRAEFSRAGFATGPLAVGGDGAIVFAVDDEVNGLTAWPRLRVYVFADDATATAAHHKAHGRDQAYRNRLIRDSDDSGPQLLSGYGFSVWHRNIALIQASDPQDRGAVPVEPDCTPEFVATGTSAPELASPNYILPSTGVDPVFIDLVLAMYGREVQS